MIGLAVSNIAWDATEEADVARALRDRGVRRVEIAPTKVFEDPTDVSDAAIADYRGFWEAHGIDVVAFQSMLFGYPDLSIFGDEAVVRATVERLGAFIDLAGRMGAGRLVFGSPRNRRRPAGMDDEEIQDAAIAVFGELGRRAADAGVIFCIEPNPPQYGCDFVTTAAEGERLVRAVAHPGFGLHLDVAGMTLAGDTPAEAVRSAADVLCHYHVSAPDLGPIERDVVDHVSAFRALAETSYSGTVSIEMRPGDPGEAVSRVESAVDLARAAAVRAGLDLDPASGAA
ncbi:MAG: sugar phosphate isomerase/epimerase [Microbacterium sp.]|uniref:sugar phosphate isomerase/epimerase family protein n=1 Tax=unclassified Microbacterium TaxID=2609290 RepID=UPI001AC9212E|nr:MULTISPECIES: sugar phosphate isomerase/epimerase family protein [unclassified Microbacterium]MBN9210085.1 sugar phosphate isomerase/epimerase [Microbacterium sp.]